MKKLIILTILCLGMGISSQAQTLNCQAYNSTSTSWKVDVFNSASPGSISLNIAPGTFGSGSINPAAFPLKVNLSNGSCYVTGASIALPTSPVSFGTITDSCGNTHNYAVKKTANGNYAMKLIIN